MNTKKIIITQSNTKDLQSTINIEISISPKINTIEITIPHLSILLNSLITNNNKDLNYNVNFILINYIS